MRDAKKRRRAAYSAAAGVDRENKSDDADTANEAEAEDSAQAGVNGYLSAFLLVMVAAGFFATVRPTWGHLHGLSGLHYESGFCDIFVACRGVQPLTISLMLRLGKFRFPPLRIRRAIFVLFVLNLYGGWQTNSIFTAKDLARLGGDG